MLRVCTLYSGSSANCTLIDSDGHCVLIDAGGGVKKTKAALDSLGLSYSNIEAIFITHEHSDHISGLATICRHYDIPIIANEATAREMIRLIPALENASVCEMSTGGTAKKDDFEITSFTSPHDSAECVGYRITTKYGSVGVMTDAGEETPSAKKGLCGCKIVVLESNHDKNMLMTGPYPYPLKMRIASPHGHLSNDQCAELASFLVSTGTEKMLLAHLSAENNTPDMAFSTVSSGLSLHGIAEGKDVRIRVSPRNDVSEIYIIE